MSQGKRPAARRIAGGLPVLLMMTFIRGYQAMIRPLLIGSCKFYPSCSEYAIEALQLHGLWRGSVLALRRILRCHPFTPGGIDPVPRPDPAPDGIRAD
jgi:putative membrane protein insertion efficiency factor